MAELTRDGAAAGAGGLVIANISKYGVINGKLINPAYSDSGEPDRATRWPKRAPQGDFPILAYTGGFTIIRIRFTIRTYGLRDASSFYVLNAALCGKCRAQRKISPTTAPR